jgi:NADH dehydrogenase FAD-containing subunit
MDTQTSKKRIVILGGGFGGVYTARRLEKLFKYRSDVEIVLISRDNFLLMTPLLRSAPARQTAGSRHPDQNGGAGSLARHGPPV